MIKKILLIAAIIGIAIACGKKKNDTSKDSWGSSLPGTISSSVN